MVGDGGRILPGDWVLWLKLDDCCGVEGPGVSAADVDD